MDIETIIKQFLFDHQFRMEPGTLKLFKTALRQFQLYSGKPFEEITKSDIRSWLNYLSTEKGYKPSTLNTKLAALINFYRYCIEEDFITQNPTNNINYVYEEEKLPQYLSMEQLAQLREFLKGRIQERAIMEVLYATGARISELIAMKKTEINWSERYIVIPEGKRKVGRIVLFTIECAEHLKAYLDSRSDDSPSVFLLFNSDGTLPKNSNMLAEWFRYYSKRLEFKVTPHTLRHTLAAHLARKGMPLVYIQALMGHESFHTTRIYAKLHDHARKEMYDEWM
ncbi:tyrosine-type recombinase/integrase [Sporosarcina oncorhynchi]|uniref:Tyrosine-type recombinase/integrase n=1 Tax=Sporosarcina oncorhynchi TaxID=3056444 RepID=A0ABZ0L648_9BACL|nr:tyrosine-type recombinase/integrase [Sporosarcina sp. T2O-4]WOV88045.1 tyrosine-type recombinase/integrase [Sporosarcina sp. T2O-4]